MFPFRMPIRISTSKRSLTFISIVRKYTDRGLSFITTWRLNKVACLDSARDTVVFSPNTSLLGYIFRYFLSSENLFTEVMGDVSTGSSSKMSLIPHQVLIMLWVNCAKLDVILKVCYTVLEGEKVLPLRNNWWNVWAGNLFLVFRLAQHSSFEAELAPHSFSNKSYYLENCVFSVWFSAETPHLI